MYEAHQIVGIILIGAWVTFLAVLNLSGLIAYIYGSYLHDGDKKMWSLMEVLEIDDIGEWCIVHIFVSGVVLCFTLATMFVIKVLGIWLLYIGGTMGSVWLTLYSLRAVIRLNKKLDKHEKDTNAHKGE